MNIHPVAYKVTSPFGLEPEGSFRRAYIVGGEPDDEQVMLFHPPEKGGCGSMELATRSARDDKAVGQVVFVSASNQSYVNITTKQSKMYKQLILDQGWDLPKNLEIIVPKASPTAVIKPSGR